MSAPTLENDETIARRSDNREYCAAENIRHIRTRGLGDVIMHVSRWQIYFCQVYGRTARQLFKGTGRWHCIILNIVTESQVSLAGHNPCQARLACKASILSTAQPAIRSPVSQPQQHIYEVKSPDNPSSKV